MQDREAAGSRTRGRRTATRGRRTAAAGSLAEATMGGTEALRGAVGTAAMRRLLRPMVADTAPPATLGQGGAAALGRLAPTCHTRRTAMDAARTILVRGGTAARGIPGRHLQPTLRTAGGAAPPLAATLGGTQNAPRRRHGEPTRPPVPLARPRRLPAAPWSGSDVASPPLERARASAAARFLSVGPALFWVTSAVGALAHARARACSATVVWRSSVGGACRRGIVVTLRPPIRFCQAPALGRGRRSPPPLVCRSRHGIGAGHGRRGRLGLCIRRVPFAKIAP
mmetsp:Transcript_112324/g.312194  ORF Transcript_112324/g.312194 Transcript_112324/m.312194 type:complete len:283 (+) Transcript_112324:287-1135(+)